MNYIVISAIKKVNNVIHFYTFIQNIVILTILAKKRKIHRTNIIRLIISLLILKILPLLSYFPNYLSFTLKDINTF